MLQWNGHGKTRAFFSMLKTIKRANPNPSLRLYIYIYKYSFHISPLISVGVFLKHIFTCPTLDE